MLGLDDGVLTWFVRQGVDGVVDVSNGLGQEFLASCDVLVETRAVEVMPLELLGQDTWESVHHVDVGVVVVGQGFPDVTLQTLNGGFSILGVQATHAIGRLQGEVELVGGHRETSVASGGS